MNQTYLAMELPPWLNQKLVAGNDGLQVAQFFLSLFVLWLVGRIAKAWLNKLASGMDEKQGVRAVLLRCIGKGLPLVGIWGGLRLGVVFISLGSSEDVVLTSLDVLLTVAVGLLVYYLVEVPDRWLRAQTEKTESKFDDMLVPIVRKSMRVTVVLFAVVSIAQTLSDKPVSALIAGLGLGGLAFALAAQDTIKNLFGSLVIFTDKPFGLGDRISFDGHDGTIEEVGLRSTRLRRSDGHLVTIPNGELANSTIHNIAKRPFIRRNLTLGLTYDTSPEKVRQRQGDSRGTAQGSRRIGPGGRAIAKGSFQRFLGFLNGPEMHLLVSPPCLLGLHGVFREA